MVAEGDTGSAVLCCFVVMVLIGDIKISALSAFAYIAGNTDQSVTDSSEILLQKQNFLVYIEPVYSP